MSVTVPTLSDPAGSTGTHTNGANATILSPCVTTYDPKAFINIDADLQESVEITGIDKTFVVTLTDASDCADFLNGFAVSGVSVDARLSRNDINMSGLAVTLGGASFKAVIEKVIEDATVNGVAGADDVDAYLAKELKNAFITAFGTYLTEGAITSAPVTGAADNGSDAVDPSGNNPLAEGGNTAGTVAVTAQTAIQGFTVDVLTEKATAANNLVAQHGAGPLASMFRQCGRARILAYLPEGADGEAEKLITDALPLTVGDSVEFVFDINVDTAGAQPGAAGAEDVPTVDSMASGYNVSQFSLNLANRRVAFKIILSPAAKAAGALFDGLREQAAAAAGTYDGPGTQPASASA